MLLIELLPRRVCEPQHDDGCYEQNLPVQKHIHGESHTMVRANRLEYT